ncbi:MAG TPA: sigma factor, partial [Solirubrobacterales bacterium]|nr:sigma factor [Solirubrobacterales bacterium]
MDLIPTRQLSDDALVAAAAEGDERAFGELADRHGHWLLSQARKITPDRAEDVAEAALMNAYRSLRSGTRPADLERWLRTIVRNAAITAQEFEGRPTETTRGRSATEGSLRMAVDRARRRLRATVPAPFPFPGLDVARRALARVRDAGPVGGAVAAGAVAATVAAVAFAGGLPGGGDGEPGDLALAQVESPGIVAPPLGRAEPRDAADRGGADRKRSRRGD